MILLQEAMAAGPFILLYVGVFIAAIINLGYLASQFIKQEKKQGVERSGFNEKEIRENEQTDVYRKGRKISVFIILGISLLGLLSLLNWMCTIKFD